MHILLIIFRFTMQSLKVIFFLHVIAIIASYFSRYFQQITFDAHSTFLTDFREALAWIVKN